MIEACTGAILAGGASRRMGRDKAAIRVGGETLLERTARVLGAVFPRVVCVGRSREAGVPAGVAALDDYRTASGPLSGLAAALGASSTTWVFVAACDMPWLDAAFIEELWRRGRSGALVRAIVPRVDGESHPLCAFYATSLAAAARAAVERGELGMRAFAAAAGALHVDFAPADALTAALANVNTPDDLARVLDPGRGTR